MSEPYTSSIQCLVRAHIAFAFEFTPLQPNFAVEFVPLLAILCCDDAVMVTVWCRRRYHRTCSQRQFADSRLRCDNVIHDVAIRARNVFPTFKILGALQRRCDNVHATFSQPSDDVRNKPFGVAVCLPGQECRNQRIHDACLICYGLNH